MKRRRTAQSAFLSLCILLGLSTFFTGVVVALFASVAPETSTREDARKVDAQARRQHLAPGAPAGGFYEAWVARYNGTGNTYDYGKAVAVDHAGNVYVAGTSLGLGTGNDYATIKYDSAGQQQWVALYNDFDGPDNQLYAMTIATPRPRPSPAPRP